MSHFFFEVCKLVQLNSAHVFFLCSENHITDIGARVLVNSVANHPKMKKFDLECVVSGIASRYQKSSLSGLSEIIKSRKNAKKS